MSKRSGFIEMKNAKGAAVVLEAHLRRPIEVDGTPVELRYAAAKADPSTTLRVVNFTGGIKGLEAYFRAFRTEIESMTSTHRALRLQPCFRTDRYPS